MKNQENIISCCRCGEDIGPEIEQGNLETVLSLSLNEQSFIHSKFKGPLCIPCLNQLKTSYRILNGEYNVAAGRNVSL